MGDRVSLAYRSIPNELLASHRDYFGFVIWGETQVILKGGAPAIRFDLDH